MPIVVSRSAVSRANLAITAFLVLANLALHFGMRSDDSVRRRLRSLRFFNLDAECCVGSWYSTILLFGAGVVHMFMARDACAHARGFARHWLALGFIFMGLSLDEAAGLHERMTQVVRETIGREKARLYYGWVLPGFVQVLALGCAYAKFLMHLSRRTAIKIACAGALFVGGAIGFEIPAGALAMRDGVGSLRMVAFTSIEETLEMLGTILFIDALPEQATRRRAIFRLEV